MADGSDKREFARVPLEVRVDLFNDNTFFSGFTENISEGGLFIATEVPFEIGTRLSIKLSLLGALPDEHTVVVRWIRPPNAIGGLPPGMGVQFEELDEEEQGKLQEFLAQRVKDTLFFDLD